MKSMFASRTFWVSFVQLVLCAFTLPWAKDIPPEYLPIVGMITAGLNILLRRLTTDSATFTFPWNMPPKLPMILFVCLLGLGVVGCGPVPPPNVSPAAQTAFRNTQVIKVMDLIRDTAIDANAQTPPLVSVETTRRIVTFHEHAIKIINATTVGWSATLVQEMQGLQKTVPSSEQSLLGPYFTLALNALKGVL